MSAIKHLTITHNHGEYVLRDVELIEYEATNYRGEKYIGWIAKGEVIGGGVTNRLFSATSFTPSKVGSVMEVNIRARRIYEQHDKPGHFWTDISFCG